MMTTVRNLTTGQERVYSLAPEQAVVNAWYQSQRNNNWWTYDYSLAQVGASGRTVSCGDWCAMLPEKTDSGGQNETV